MSQNLSSAAVMIGALRVKTLLKFQVKEGECIQTMSGPGYNTYPCIYRSQIYFLSSTQARDEFIQDPIKFVSQPTPKPVVPIKIAVIGPPKSGKTTCKSILTLYLIETPFNAFANRAYPDQAALVRAA